MAGRACMREVLTQVWLEINELFDKEVNTQKESLKKSSWGSRKLPQAHEKVCNEKERKKWCLKNIFDGRKDFIRRSCHGY